MHIRTLPIWGPSFGPPNKLGWTKSPWLRRQERAEMARRAEQGKPRAEIGLILRTLKSLGVSLDLKVDSLLETPSIGKAKSPDITAFWTH